MEQNAAGDVVLAAQLTGTDAYHTALGHAAAAAAAAAAVSAAVPGAAEAKGRGHKHVHSHQEVLILALRCHCPVQLGCSAPQAAVMIEGGGLAWAAQAVSREARYG